MDSVAVDDVLDACLMNSIGYLAVSLYAKMAFDASNVAPTCLYKSIF